MDTDVRSSNTSNDPRHADKILAQQENVRPMCHVVWKNKMLICKQIMRKKINQMNSTKWKVKVYVTAIRDYLIFFFFTIFTREL